MVTAPLKNKADCLARQLRRTSGATNHHSLAGAPTARAVQSPGRQPTTQTTAFHQSATFNS
jgi:hypothetical protein